MEHISIPYHVYLDALTRAEQANDKNTYLHLSMDFVVRDNQVFAKVDPIKCENRYRDGTLTRKEK